MKSIYIESSAILTWLFGEPEVETVVNMINESEIVISSVLSIIETKRALLRAEFQQEITPSDAQRLKGQFSNTIIGWSFLEITESVRDRAAQPFPTEPIRSLDAIHLASMLELLQLYPDMEALSFDNRIIDNIEPLGLINAISMR